MFKSNYTKAGISWLKLQQIKYQLNSNARSVKLFGSRIYFTTPLELLHGIREIFMEEIYRQSLRPDPFIIDCGANIGLSIIYMKQLYPAATIIGFEPDGRNFELLQKNVLSMNYQGVTVRKEAVWIQNIELEFADTGSMSSRIEQGGAQKTKPVTAVRLKDLLTRPVDFLKLDIEGAEYAVLRDIREQLPLVKNMFLEYHGNFDQSRELSEIFHWLTEQGFSYYIKEASNVYHTPFERGRRVSGYDVQLNIFCFRVNWCAKKH
ncbi:MAG: FkbM family methyltransferase [Citrobacter freundii]|nr:MAG: FkbM family methyltransferase [Citrobacter freundii]